MKRLFAFLALCLPIYILAQGFGSFTHDQPYFAKDVRGGDSPPVCDLGEWNPALNVYTYALYDFNCLNQSAGTPITNIYDLGTNALTLAPTWTTNYPYCTNNVLEINNRRYGFFDGINDNLKNTNGVLAIAWAGPTTIFYVAATFTPTNATGEIVFDNGNNNVQAGGMIQMLYTAGSDAYTYTGPNGGETQIGPFTLVTNWMVTEVTFNGASSYIKTNGVTAKSGTHSTTTRRVGVTLGAGQALNNTQNAHVKMAWAGFYTNILDATTSSNIFYYLTNRFGIQ